MPAESPTFRWGAAFFEGVDRYHRGAFFEAHEAWEELWRAEQDAASRVLLQGLIQVVAGYHQYFVLQRSEAAARVLRRGLDKLDEVAATYDEALPALQTFRAGVRANLAALSAAENEGPTGPGAPLRLEDLPRLGR